VLAPSPAAAQVQQGGQALVVDSLRVEGNVRLNPQVILGTTGLQPGMEVTFRDIQRAEKLLWSTGQFENIIVEVAGREGLAGAPGEPLVVTFRVEERDVLRRIQIRGLNRVDPDMIIDSVGLAANQSYAPTRVTAAKELIRSELASKGIPFARIDDRLEPVEGMEKTVDLIMEVTEGQRVTIAQVDFFGNEAFVDDELYAAIATKPEAFLWFRAGSFEEDIFEEDLLDRLPAWYASRGFLDMEVHADTLIIDPQTGKARIEITVEEGDRYRLGEFSVDGNSRFPTSDLERYFNLTEGGLLATIGIGETFEENPVFDNSAFEAAVQEVRSLYTNNGYLYVQITPYLTRTDSTGADGDLLVNAGWRITEGLPAYVRRVDVVGNDFTHERVVREQIFMLPGDVYSEARLIQSWQGIQSLGFFETPMDPPAINPDPQTGEVDIVFNVRERQTGSINFGTALGGGVGLSGFIGYDQPNLFGQAKAGSVRWDFGRYTNNFTASYTDPSILQSRISGNLSLFNSRDRFFRFSTGQRRRVGFSTRFGFPLPSMPRTRFFAGYSLANTRYELREGESDSSVFGLPPGTLSSINLGLTRSTMNHPLFPTNGSRQGVTWDLSGGPLGGDGNFTKLTLDGAWYVPAGEIGGSGGPASIRFTFGLSAKTGAIFGDADNFPFEQFWLGGVQFGERLRGYEETTVTPQGYFPRGSNAISDIDRLGSTFFAMYAEYAVRFGDTMSLSLFYDAGNVWDDPASIDPTRLFRGAGIGGQLVTPFGPIGLDYAYGFDKTAPGWQLHFRFGGGF
jgi:outer membrane protein insertion porin family